VASHLLGQGEQKSYLRISHHDAIIIIHTLDQFSTGEHKPTIADELHIGDPESLSNWMQTKVPVARDAVRQKGFTQGNQDFIGGRVGRGKGSPLGHPSVKSLVAAGEEVVSKGLRKNHYTKGLRDALMRLDAELYRITGRHATPEEPKKKAQAAPGEEGEIVDTGTQP